jgi:hypothetical protein
MYATIGVCVYCERTPEEIVAASDVGELAGALRPAIVADNRIELCPRCIRLHAPYGADDPWRLDSAPITFPPGITAIEHHCPELEEEGFEEEAYFVLEFSRDGAYYVGWCEHCGVLVRSLAED